VCRSKHVEQLRNTGIINSTTRSHFVGYFCTINVVLFIPIKNLFCKKPISPFIDPFISTVFYLNELFARLYISVVFFSKRLIKFVTERYSWMINSMGFSDSCASTFAGFEQRDICKTSTIDHFNTSFRQHFSGSDYGSWNNTEGKSY